MDVVPVVSSFLYPADANGMKPLLPAWPHCVRACVCVEGGDGTAAASDCSICSEDESHEVAPARRGTTVVTLCVDHFQRSQTDRQPHGSATAPSPDIAEFLQLLP